LETNTLLPMSKFILALCLVVFVVAVSANVEDEKDLETFVENLPALSEERSLLEGRPFKGGKKSASKKRRQYKLGKSVRAAPLPKQYVMALEKKPVAPADKFQQAIGLLDGNIKEKANEIKTEAKWVASVRKAVKAYETKMSRVTLNIKKLKSSMKRLIKKKQQLQNIRIQRRLQKQLRAAAGDLSTLSGALGKVRAKAAEYSSSSKNVKETIGKITNQLKSLKMNQIKSSRQYSPKQKLSDDKVIANLEKAVSA